MSHATLFPGSCKCILCGPEADHLLRFHLEQEGPQTVLRCVPPAWLEGFAGTLHGGYLAVLFDEVVGTAICHAAGGAAVTRRLTLEYLKPVAVGEPLALIGTCQGPLQGHLFAGEGLALGEDGVVRVRARGEYAVMSGKVLGRILRRNTDRNSP